MNRPISIGLLDSGPDVRANEYVKVASAFVVDAVGEVVRTHAVDDPTGHGTAMARIIARHVPESHLLVAQVFSRSGAGSAAAIAAGLDWLVDEGVAAVNMSFGLRRDRSVLEAACRRALDAGVVLVASAPARGAGVYPASYPAVISATGDARCGAREISHLAGAEAEFGACPRFEAGRERATPIAGASCGAAHLSGEIACFLQAGGDPDGVREHLRSIAQYHGLERRA
ncbi:MAG: subtilisin-like serine protease QhpE [Gammaproteobacteria bacterium]